MVALVGKRIVLREHMPDDLAAVLEYSSDPMVARYVPWEPNTEQATRRFLEGAMKAASAEPRRSYVLATVDRESRELIGAARISIAPGTHRRADIGYVLRRDRWNRGYATEAARMLIDFGFRDLGLHRIWATSHPANRASSRVLEAIGMGYEGRIRSHMFVKGAWRDSLVYSILRPDWPPKEST